MIPFEPHPRLKNPHWMTLAGRFWPRSLERLPAAGERYFEVEPGIRLLAHCHWQPEPARRPALVIVHGLEGSSDSRYVLGTAEKAWVAGFNVIRMNQRNCGGTEALAPTLYNSGLSGDYRAVVRALARTDGLREIFLSGFSMGGNLVLKAAGEMGRESPVPAAFAGVAAVCPSMDLAACVDAIHQPRNAFYERYFVRNLIKRYRKKVELFPQHFALNGVDRIRTIREFDDVITAPICGYGNAENYYDRASAKHVVGAIAAPTLVITAKDDPMVPHASVRRPEVLGNPRITLLDPAYGGHCAFISRHGGGDERFWAECRIVEFCSSQSRLLSPG
ncbi:MAG TPA: alpha/beta fold hydrolase [Patescibacteria group bacterium]|nr:alpha/beta fold hydrolase [Patescibacteria group bacterium]